MGRLIDGDSFEAGIKILFGESNPIIHIVINKLHDQPTVEAITKDQYKARLKADLVAMLEDLKKEMNPIKECEYQIYGKEHWNFAGKCQDAVQQKIDELKAESENYGN